MNDGAAIHIHTSGCIPHAVLAPILPLKPGTMDTFGNIVFSSY